MALRSLLGNSHRCRTIVAAGTESVLHLHDPQSFRYGPMTDQGKTILIIDDEESQREALGDILSHAGYQVLTGGDYADGMALYRQYGPEISLLLVDVALPHENGFELARALWGIEPGLRVLYMSGGVGAKLCRFYSVAATNLLSKPVASSALLRRIRQLLGST